ncbi:IS66 family transposase [Pontiellaceae bacterium B12219]|nr:IS66 family transposase [Pontiellaceae bacterium B12219]
MNSNENSTQGRASYTEEERRELIEEFNSAGLTQAAFCREWNINPKTLARWLRIERQETEVSFCEVDVRSESPPADELRICLPNGIDVLLRIEELREVQDALDEATEKIEELDAEKESRRGKRKPLRERIPEDLPTERVILIPDEVKAAPECYKMIGEETVEELDVTPTQYFRRIIVREKYVKVDDRSAAPVIAPAPKKRIPNSYASVGLILHIILGKYCDHLPLYRQEQIFKSRYGVEISRKTMGNWMFLIADWLTLIYEALRNEIRETHYIQADETVIKYQDQQRDYCPNGYLWAYHSPGIGVLFEWFSGRGNECLDNMLTGFSGLLQTDGYAAYNTWLNNKKHAEEKKHIIHAACWAHARRYFVEAPNYPPAEKNVRLIKGLYQIEAELREHPELDRAAYRQEHAPAILDQLKELLDQEAPRQLPESQFGKAIKYTLNRWDELNHYLQHSELEIDNNLVENAIRPTAIGKKNFLFFGSPSSGQTSAVIYSLVETCRKLDINPAEYLRDVLTALPTMGQHEAVNWTPSKWKAVQPQPDTPTA